jgi:6-phosphogluconolactonase
MAKALMFVGSCTSKLGYVAKPAGQGISALRVDIETGAAEVLSHEANVVNPTFVAVAPDGRALLAVSELAGANEGRLSAYSIDAGSGSIGLLDRIGTHGYTPAHAGFDRSGRFAGAVNYSDAPAGTRSTSVLVVERTAEGGIGAVTGEAEHQGETGPDTGRQDRSHAHCVRWTPDNRFVVVADLGLDRLVVHRFDAATGALSPHGEAALAPGAGPRHFVFHPNGRWAYVANELNSTVMSFAFAAADGTFTPIGVTPTRPAAASGINYPAAIQIDATGRFVLVSNRGDDSLARLAVGADGVARFESTTPSGGRVPRDFAFDPSGRLVAVANQESDRIDFFRYADGELTRLGHVAAGSPTAIAFHPTLG